MTGIAVIAVPHDPEPLAKPADLDVAFAAFLRLEGADLSTAEGLTQAQVDSAIIDEHTRLPDHLQGPGESRRRRLRP
jgi:hypothetical protein